MNFSSHCLIHTSEHSKLVVGFEDEYGEGNIQISAL